MHLIHVVHHQTSGSLFVSHIDWCLAGWTRDELVRFIGGFPQHWPPRLQKQADICLIDVNAQLLDLNNSPAPAYCTFALGSGVV